MLVYDVYGPEGTILLVTPCKVIANLCAFVDCTVVERWWDN